MSIDIRWYDEAKTILLLTYPSEWEWPEFIAFWEGPVTQHLDEADGPVSIIANYNGSVLNASHITMLPKIAKLPVATHPNIGMGYNYGAKGMLFQTVSIFNKVFTSKSKIVSSLEEALADIEKNSQT